MTQPAEQLATIALRDYQQRALGLVRAEMRAGRRRVVLVMPTGSGKTRTGAAACRAAVAKGNPVLWLAHRTELISQAAATLESLGARVGVIAAQLHRGACPDAPIQVASIQTLLARPDACPEAELIVGDECHHLSEGAKEWSGLLGRYPKTPILGLTATPETGSGAPLSLFDALVVGASVRELTDAGHLVPCEGVRPASMLEPGQIAQCPVEAYVEHGRGPRGMRQAILFARSVEEAQGYAARLNERSVRAECVTATTPAADREAALELFRRGVVRVLTNVYVLTEGTDLPMAEVCILARGAGSAGMLIQMVGRVLRPAPGKTSALLIDLRGVTHLHGYPEDERTYSLTGRGMRLVVAPRCRVCQADVSGGYPCESCGYQPTGPGDGAQQTTIAGVALERFGRMRAQSADERAVTLERWVRRALDAGHKVASVRHKWRAVYGEELPFERLRAAELKVRACPA